MNSITPERMNALVETHAKSGAQRSAITAALTELADELIVEKPIQMSVAVPDTELVLVIVSGMGLTDKDRANFDLHVTHGRAEYKTMTIVTTGHRGIEADAESWAKNRGIPVLTFAPVWQQLQPDGTTKWDGNAASMRTRRLKQMVTARATRGLKTVVCRYGTEKDTDKIEQALVSCGALALPGSPHYKAPADPVPDVLERESEAIEAQAQAQGVTVDVAEALDAPANL